MQATCFRTERTRGVGTNRRGIVSVGCPPLSQLFEQTWLLQIAIPQRLEALSQ